MIYFKMYRLQIFLLLKAMIIINFSNVNILGLKYSKTFNTMHFDASNFLLLPCFFFSAIILKQPFDSDKFKNITSLCNLLIEKSFYSNLLRMLMRCPSIRTPFGSLKPIFLEWKIQSLPQRTSRIKSSLLLLTLSNQNQNL